MKTNRFFLALALGLFFVGTQDALAQRSASMDLTVTANNLGIFTCNITAPAGATFDFGNVDSDGTLSSTGVAGVRNGADDGADYEALAAAQWTCRAAPASTVDIDLTSIAADHTGGMGDDNLTVRIPDPGTGTSTGYQAFTSGLDLITGMSVGNAASAVSGDIDLNLSVLDTDPTGANTWIVRLRAQGTP